MLEHSLHNASLIVLGLHEQPHAVENPWQFVLQQSSHSAYSLSPDTHISQVYDNAGGELLILGEPGSGKTTLLLELARELIDRAKKDDTYPMPVVFNLSSWIEEKRSITEWLVEELNTKYQVPPKLGRLWVNADQIPPLLDGLDEVSATYRLACVDAINIYRKRHMVPVVVCSRNDEYQEQTTRLLLRTAVIVQPLTSRQIDDYLSSAGKQLAAASVALRRGIIPKELVSTPLMISVLALAYHGKSVEDFPVTDSLDEQRRQIFATYIQRMLQHRGDRTHYRPQQTIHWLGWLARQMVQRRQTEFYIEWIQPDWLAENRLLRIYYLVAVLSSSLFLGILSGLAIGLLIKPVYGLLVGVLIGLFSIPIIKPKKKIVLAEIVTGLWKSLLFGMIIGPIFGLLLALIGWMTSELVRWHGFGLVSSLLIGPLICLLAVLLISLLIFILMFIFMKNFEGGRYYENFSYSLMGLFLLIMTPALIIFVIFGLLFGLIVGLYVLLVDVHIISQVSWLPAGLLAGMLAGTIFFLRGETSIDVRDSSDFVKPNQGVRRSAMNGLVFGLLSGLLVGLLIWLIFGPIAGLFAGLVVGLFAGLYFGGGACIQHLVLRLLLRYENYAPLHYSCFLDYATERIFLRKVGGGYIFIHNLLRDHFAYFTTSADDHNDHISAFHYQVGLTYFDKHEYEKALAAFEKAIQLTPDTYTIYFKKGHTLKRLGRIKEAEQAYKKARQLRDSK